MSKKKDLYTREKAGSQGKEGLQSKTPLLGMKQDGIGLFVCLLSDLTSLHKPFQ
jgi:hypothetical protein